MSEGIDRALIQQEESAFEDRTNWAYCDVCDNYMEDCICDQEIDDLPPLRNPDVTMVWW